MEDQQPIHTWFGLSYSAYLIIPRAHEQSLGAEWWSEWQQALADVRAHTGKDWPTYNVYAKDKHNKSYAKDPHGHKGYDVVPRLALQEVPLDLQRRIVALMEPVAERLSNLHTGCYTVKRIDHDGTDPWSDYRHGHVSFAR